MTKNQQSSPFFGIVGLKKIAYFCKSEHELCEAMKNVKMYEAGDKMISVIRDNYNILQAMNSFGIYLGFGDKTVDEVCKEQGVDTFTFLTVINYTVNGYEDQQSIEKISVPTLLKYLRASHDYYLDFQLPMIRKELADSLDENDNLARLILKLYDEYARGVTVHMRYEEKHVFPYVQKLLDGEISDTYDIDTYSKHHSQLDQKLKELKNIIIKYLPADGPHNNKLMATLYNIYNNEEWLHLHCNVENDIFIPVIRYIESQRKQQSVELNAIPGMKSQGEDAQLSQRERDVIVALVQGMSNKEIADHLCISTNTVITHRRNIAKKLQIHSPAGLTIYAIVNKLVSIDQTMK